ncbi:Ribosomal protein S6 kinase alpha-5 [Zootermopsis nevadensis]|uniref:Ribosomal protein S6 kinase alpha-5 n=1 Tax=Zootermopsis nevadensis TaxID=136037 RepID=A0A067QIN2_ZOONE|nr:Ribosomal protein S6 kinase alpha-5 [Zootermopsis nevadensis]
MLKLIYSACRRSFRRRSRDKLCDRKNIQIGHHSQTFGQNGDSWFLKRNAIGYKKLPPEPTNEVVHSQNNEQDMEELNQGHRRSSCPSVKDRIKKFSDELLVEREKVFVLLDKSARIEKELKGFRKKVHRLDDGDVTDFGIRKLDVKMTDVEEKCRSGNINGLNKVAGRFSAENENLKLQDNSDGIIINRQEEGEYSKIKNNQNRGKPDVMKAQKVPGCQEWEDSSENSDWGPEWDSDSGPESDSDSDWGSVWDSVSTEGSDEHCCCQCADIKRRERAINLLLANEPPARICEKAKLLNSSVDNSETSLPELEDFTLLKVLGKGGFGTVYLSRKRGGADDGALYAVKTMVVSKMAAVKYGAEEYCVERDVHERVSESPFLVGLYYTFHTSTLLCLVLDYYAGGDLSYLLTELEKFTSEETRSYLAEIIEAVEYLHELKVIHRDLKLENILVDAQGHIAVADYGLCKQFICYKEGDRAYSQCGTREYMAPEMIIGEGYSFEVDWWSVGIIMYEMSTGHRPFKYNRESNDKVLDNEILHQTPHIPSWFSVTEADFVGRLLEKDPNTRMGAGKGGVENIKTHLYFTDINWDDVSKKRLKMPQLLEKSDFDDEHCSLSFSFT